MNIKFLEQIFDDQETDYYIVEHLDNTFFVGIPTPIKHARTLHFIDHKFKDQTWEKIRSLLKTPIDCNLTLNGEYTPFQQGMTVEYIDKFCKVDCDTKVFLEATKEEKNKALDFYGYMNLIREIKKAESKADMDKFRESQTKSN